MPGVKISKHFFFREKKKNKKEIGTGSFQATGDEGKRSKNVGDALNKNRPIGRAMKLTAAGFSRCDNEERGTASIAS